MAQKKLSKRVAETARGVALDALLRVVLDGAYLDRALGPLCDKAGLAPEDRGLATELAFGVLRRQLWLDAPIARAASRPLHEIDAASLMALRLGAYQLYALDRIPPHAAVAETVAALKARRPSATSFVNAVLRKLAASEAPPVRLDDPRAELDALAHDASLPPWILREFARALSGPDRLDAAKRLPPRGEATAQAIAHALSRPAQPTLRVLSRRLARDTLLARLQAEGAEAQPTRMSPYGIRTARIGDPSQLAGFGHDFIAQDEAAQWTARLAEGERGPALDACAAPGGKALALWDAGVEPLVAIEAQPKRAELLRKTLARAEVACEVRLADAREPPPAPGYATLFIDAPCTGSGTLRRHPELRWKLDRGAIVRMAATQAAILEGVAPQALPGAALIYAVCSVFPEEGQDQIATFLERHPEFSLEAWLETLSHHDVMDGFFAAKLRRR